jgi:hypothetical protein
MRNMLEYTATSWHATPSFGSERSSLFDHPVRRYKILTIDSKANKDVKFIENPRDFIAQTHTDHTHTHTHTHTATF